MHVCVPACFCNYVHYFVRFMDFKKKGMRQQGRESETERSRDRFSYFNFILA